MRHIALIISVFSAMLSAQAATNNVKYWDDGKPRVSKANGRPTSGYSPALHMQFSNSLDYEEGGKHYYSNTVNSFGQKERLNTEQEIIFCQAGERTFSEMIEDRLYRQPSITSSESMLARQSGLLNVLNSANAYGGLDGHGLPDPEALFSVNADATSVGFTPDMFKEAVEQTLTSNNATTNSLGRFCYRENDAKVDYRNPTASSAVYCDPNRVTEHGKEHVFLDTSSGNNCSLKLDAPIKVGETRFLRQLQEDSETTIAQGFLGCYKNNDTGLPDVVLIENPPSCTKTNRADCARTCEWAHQVMCDAKSMPRWGGGQCGSYGTMLFKDDVIEVSSVDSLSYQKEGNTQYRGEAIMACAMVSGQAQWVVNNSTCSAVENNK